MKTAQELGGKPAEFLSTTGINYATFSIILEKVACYVAQFKEQHPV